MSEISPRVNSALDFQGLGELRAQAQRDQRGALRETARQFEAMFIQTIMATMREAGFKSDLIESSSMETFQSMHDKEIALSMTRRGGLGLADMLVDQMERNRMVPAAQALAARGERGGLRLDSAQRERRDQGAGFQLEPDRPARPLATTEPVFSLPRPRQGGLPLSPGASIKPLDRGDR